MTRREKIDAAIEAAIARDPKAGLQPCPKVRQPRTKKLFERRTPRWKIAKSFKAGSGVLS